MYQEQLPVWAGQWHGLDLIIQSSNPFTASSVGAQVKYDQICVSLQEG